MLCEYGCNQEAKVIFKNGKHCCNKNTSLCPKLKELKVIRTKEQYKKGERVSGFKKYNEVNPRHKKGTYKHSKEALDKLKILRQEKNYLFKSKEYKEKRSLEMKNRYANGWESTAGRTRKIDYFSNIAGNIKLDGNWELKVAKYLDNLGVIWERNKKRFIYFNELTNKIATYCPDFYIVEWNCYIEVKGYITDLDRCKWKQFKENLQIWDKGKLRELQILGE